MLALIDRWADWLADSPAVHRFVDAVLTIMAGTLGALIIALWISQPF